MSLQINADVLSICWTDFYIVFSSCTGYRHSKLLEDVQLNLSYQIKDVITPDKILCDNRFKTITYLLNS